MAEANLGQPALCVANGELQGPFNEIYLNPDQVDLRIDDPTVIEAGRICLNKCAYENRCAAEARRWVNNKGFNHWRHYEDDGGLPAVLGGYFLVVNSRGSRRIDRIGSDQDKRLGKVLCLGLPEAKGIDVSGAEQAIGPTDAEILQLEKELQATEGEGTAVTAASAGAVTMATGETRQNPSKKVSTKTSTKKDSGDSKRVNSAGLQGSVSEGKPSHWDELDLVKIYLNDAGRYPLLTKDDEVRLSKLIEAGLDAADQLGSADNLSVAKRRELRNAVKEGKAAKQQFVNSNLRLVVSIARRYQSSGLPLLDLIQEGNLGLMHAVEKFDWRKGFKFSTYATWWIRQSTTRGIANTVRTIRLPVHAGDNLARLQKARARLDLNLGRPATFKELAIDTGMTEEKVVETLQFAAEPLSLSQPLREDSDAELGDIVEDRNFTPPDEEAANSLLPEEIEKMLAPLAPREREILKLRFGLDRGEPRTLEEVGEHFSLTRERIRQLEARALSKLRHPAADTGAKEFLR